MPNTGIDYNRIKEELDNCNKPMIMYHDDADGLCSYLLLYRYKKEGKGIVIKSTPKIDEKYLYKVEEIQPDKIFIVDIAIVEESFTENVRVPIIWIDHHEPLQVNNTIYFNPRKKDKGLNLPASYLCYKVVEQDLWIAMTGIVSDWVYIPEIYREFSEKYPDLLPKDVDRPEKALFDTTIGKLAKIFNFVLKGETKSAIQCAKVLTRINDPYEILNQTSPQGKYIMKKFESISKQYDEMLGEALKSKDDSRILIFKYNDNKMSFTGELANELLYRFPDKIIMIIRFKSGEAKCSLRSSKEIILPPILEKSLVGISGYGGGHEHACGCCVKQDQLNEFIENLKNNLP